MDDLADLFRPRGVAVIGATDRQDSVGRSILSNLKQTYGGDIVPINPARDEVLGLSCYDDFVAAPAVDVAVVVLPAGGVVDALEEIGQTTTKNVVVISAGFSETGSDGAKREQRLIDVATSNDLNLVGPNSLGVMSTTSGFNASFAPEVAPSGSISFFSQSGALVTAVLDYAIGHGIGFRDVVSLGNEAVLDQTDFVRYWGEDPETDVIMGYVEAIDHGREFIDICRDVTADTPIVLVKAGRTEAGAKAASSHTGSIAGNVRAYEAAFEQAGIVSVDTIQDLFDAVFGISELPTLDTPNVAIVTNAGGPGVMATDVIGDSHLSLAEFDDASRTALFDELPEEATAYNPVDVLGDADVDRLIRSAELVCEDANVGSLLLIAAPTTVLDFDSLVDGLLELHSATEIPIVTGLMGGSSVEAAIEKLREHGIPTYFDPDRSIRILDVLARQRSIADRSYADPVEYDIDDDLARAVIDSALERNRSSIGVEGFDLLRAYGIEVPDGRVVDTPEEAKEVAEEIGTPVVLKVASPDIPHKTDIGGVRLGVSIDDVESAYEEMLSRVRRHQPSATIRGVLVQEEIDTDDGTETIIGCVRDPQFGPMVLFGLGGIFVEVLEDTTVRIAPISESEAESMTEELHASELLRGARGRPPAAIDDVVEALGRISQLVTAIPSITELDVNPLVVGPDGVQAIDLQLTLEPERS